MQTSETNVNPPFVSFGDSVSEADLACAPEIEHLTELQSRFVWAFILTGGKAERSAELAGYGGGAKNMAFRNLAKRKVQDAIADKLKLQPGSALALSIGGLMRIIETGKDERAVVAAALGLMDRFGMAPPKGAPMVQVNNLNVNGEQAQSILADVQAARQQRLARMSDIPPAMPDKSLADATAAVEALEHAAGQGMGGVQVQGAPPGFPAITPPSPENSARTAEPVRVIEHVRTPAPLARETPTLPADIDGSMFD